MDYATLDVAFAYPLKCLKKKARNPTLMQISDLLPVQIPNIAGSEAPIGLELSVKHPNGVFKKTRRVFNGVEMSRLGYAIDEDRDRLKSLSFTDTYFRDRWSATRCTPFAPWANYENSESHDHVPLNIDRVEYDLRDKMAEAVRFACRSLALIDGELWGSATPIMFEFKPYERDSSCKSASLNLNDKAVLPSAFDGFRFAPEHFEAVKDFAERWSYVGTTSWNDKLPGIEGRRRLTINANNVKVSFRDESLIPIPSEAIANAAASASRVIKCLSDMTNWMKVSGFVAMAEFASIREKAMLGDPSSVGALTQALKAMEDARFYCDSTNYLTIWLKKDLGLMRDAIAHSWDCAEIRPLCEARVDDDDLGQLKI